MTELKKLNRWAPVFILVLAVTVGQAFENQSWATANRNSPVASNLPISDDGLQVLGLGRQVYSDLQLARRAALNHHAKRLHRALKRVQDNLARLNQPPALMALNAQTVIIGNNLADTSGPVDADLWVPIDTELEGVSLYLPLQNQAQARVAVKAGRIAAKKGDRATAATQLDLLVSFLNYETGAFPLQGVRADVQSAWSSAGLLPQPYWKGVLEAVQSALGEIYWVAGVNARPLLSAYNNAVSAYVLWPQRRQVAIDYLSKAQKVLSRLPDGAVLAADAHRLIEKTNLGVMGKKDLGDEDLKQFVVAIGRRIDRERVAARDKLLERFSGTETH